MKYIIIILLSVLLYFSILFVNNLFNGENLKKNISISLLSVLISLPISLIIFFAMFFALKSLALLTGLNISNYAIFTISFMGIFITLLIEFVLKIFLSSIIGRLFSKRFSNEALSKKDMLSIVKSNGKIIELIKLISMIILAAIFYLIISILLHIDQYILISIFSALINGIIYYFMFKSK